MGFFKKIFKNPLSIASIAAAPFTGGLSLGGTGILGALNTAGSIFSAVSAAQSLFGGKDKAQAPVAPAQAPPFNPVKPSAMKQPEGLGAEFSGFSPEQQRSALATRGVNQGLGSEEDAYYRNLVSRALIGDNNQVQPGNPDQYILPIESQYFSRKGLNTSDMLKFLQGLTS